MSNVVSLGFSETTLDFIRREGGVTCTANVARRFGWDMERARKELRRLEAAGVLTKRRVANPDCNGAGAAYDWMLAA